MNFCYLYCSEKMNILHLFIYTFYSFKTVLETTLFCPPCTSQKENRVVKFIFCLMVTVGVLGELMTHPADGISTRSPAVGHNDTLGG